MLKRLDNNWIIWYDMSIGKTEIYPDFVCINPDQGLFVIEVKDFRLSSIQSLTKDIWTIGGSERKNPYVQANGYCRRILREYEKLERKYQLNNKIRWNYFCAFPFISSSQQHDTFFEGIPMQNTLLKEDLRVDTILSKFASARGGQKRMNEKTFNMLRHAIDPFIKIPMRTVEDAETKIALPAVLDIKQERAAKSIGEGHRLLKGVAGSGKTLVMLYRAKLLSMLHPDWNILFLCWNASLINYLEQFYEAMGGELRQVTFNYFSQWVRELTQRTSSVRLPTLRDKDEHGQQYYEKLYRQSISKLLEYESTYGYDAILVDEAQDFEEDYFRLIVQQLNPKTNSLLICHDHAQNIYGKGVSWKSLGVDARGRVVRLEGKDDRLARNYRNTKEIARFAMALYNNRIPYTNEDDEEKVMTKLELSQYPESGPLPTVDFSVDRETEIKNLITWLKKCVHEWGVNQRDILIQYSRRSLSGIDIASIINEVKYSTLGFSVDWISENMDSKTEFCLEADTIKFCTVHSAKGMDFEAVAVIGVDDFKKNLTSTLYVACTRARKHLRVSGVRNRNHNVEKILEFAVSETDYWHTEEKLKVATDVQSDAMKSEVQTEAGSDSPTL